MHVAAMNGRSRNRAGALSAGNAGPGAHAASDLAHELARICPLTDAIYFRQKGDGGPKGSLYPPDLERAEFAMGDTAIWLLGVPRQGGGRQGDGLKGGKELLQRRPELGFDQLAAVSDLVAQASCFAPVRHLRDLQGHARVVLAELRGGAGPAA